MLRFDNGRFALVSRGLPSDAFPVYSLAVTHVLDGTEALVAGSDNGIFRLTKADTFAAVPLPSGFNGRGVMLASRNGRSHTGSLWVGTLTSGVARFRVGSGPRGVRRRECPGSWPWRCRRSRHMTWC